MGHFSINESPTNKNHGDLYKALAACQSGQEIKNFIQDICTPQEITALAERWHAVKLLYRGLSYREISQQTGMSVTTIGRVARALKYGQGGYQSVFNRLHKK